MKESEHGSEKIQACVRPDGTRHGPYLATDPAGLSTRGQYKDGHKDGHWMIEEGGQPFLSTDYSAACGEECESGVRTMYDNGKARLEQALVVNVQQGWSLRYGDDGKVDLAQCFHAGLPVLSVDKPGEKPTSPCPLAVAFPAPTGPVLSLFDKRTEAGTSLTMAIGEVLEPGANTSKVSTPGGPRQISNAFLIPMTNKRSLRIGDAVFGYSKEDGGVIGTVVSVNGKTAKLFRHRDFGQGIVANFVEVNVDALRPVDKTLDPGSGVAATLYSRDEMRVGTVLRHHDGYVAAAINGSLAVFAPGSYHAFETNPDLPVGTEVCASPFMGCTWGTVVELRPKHRGVVVEYEFMDKKDRAEFAASHVARKDRLVAAP